MVPPFLIFVLLHVTSISATYYGPHKWRPDVDSDQRGTQGQDGYLDCHLTGPDAGLLNITWIFGNQTHINRTEKYFPNNKILIIRNLQHSDGGRYACAVEDYPYTTYFYIDFNVRFESFCDFESDPCIWNSYSRGSPFWITGSLQMTRHRYTGDHTSGSVSGTFLMLDNTDLHNAGDTAVVASDTLSPSPSRCMTFWYYFKNDYPMQLSVVINTPLLNHSKVLWRLNETSDVAIWSEAMVPISDDGKNYNLRLEGTFLTDNNGPYGGIGVDDIKIQDGDCYVSPLRAAPEGLSPIEPANTTQDGEINNQTIQLNATHKNTSASEPANKNTSTSEPANTMEDGGKEYRHFCDFEGEPCSWFADKNQSRYWLTVVPQFSPFSDAYDHTTLALFGTYLYFDSALSRGAGDKAVMKSDILPPAPVRCLHFFYFFHSQMPVQLRVVVNTPSMNQRKVVWMLNETGDGIPPWLGANVPIYGEGKEYNIQIEGTSDFNGTSGGIGVDDISINDYYCQPHPLRARPKNTSARQPATTTQDDGIQTGTDFSTAA